MSDNVITLADHRPHRAERRDDMSDAPERIWIEDEFGEGDDDQWTYGTWDVRNYAGYDVEYVRADLALPAVQPDEDTIWHDEIREAALRATLLDLITEQSEGEWDDETIAKDVEVFLSRILALIDKPAHVSETPKSEHEAANMLTPATKGGDV